MDNIDGVPIDKDSERELLCALMAGPDYIFRIAAEVRPDYFYNDDYRAIYSKLLLKAQAGIEIEELTFSDGESEERQILLMRMFDNAITGTTAPFWAKKVKDCAYKRAIYELGNTFCQQASTLGTFEAADVYLRERTEQVLNKFHASAEDIYDPKAISGICEQIQAKRGNPGIHGIKTLFPIFDRVVKGLKILNLVAAPSGFGKTALALQWAWNIGVVQKHPVLYINYEMGEDDLVERLLACGSGVGLDQIQLGETTDTEHAKLEDTRKSLGAGNLYVTGCEEKTIDNTINLIHQYRAQHGIEVVFIDYIGEIGKKDNEYDQHTYALFGDWMQKIKNACALLNMKSVIMAQLNRDGYKGAPGMDNLSDSMQLIHKSSVAVALYEAKDGRPHAKLLKNRGGPIVVPIPLSFNKKCQQITEYTPF